MKKIIMEKRVMDIVFCVVESNSWQVPGLRDPTVHMVFIG